MFEVADKDRDGSLSEHEITNIISEVCGKQNTQKYELILKKFDSDKNKRIDYSEFLNLTI